MLTQGLVCSQCLRHGTKLFLCQKWKLSVVKVVEEMGRLSKSGPFCKVFYKCRDQTEGLSTDKECSMSDSLRLYPCLPWLWEKPIRNSNHLLHRRADGVAMKEARSLLWWKREVLRSLGCACSFCRWNAFAFGPSQCLSLEKPSGGSTIVLLSSGMERGQESVHWEHHSAYI